MAADSNMRENVLDYYSNVLHSKEDLKTQVCCSTDAMPTHIREVLKEIDDDIINRFYGCGSPIPPDLRGLTVLDLGCGTGRDVYILSKLVGREGRAIGIDMNEDQLAVARTYSAKQMEAFGYEKPNVEFLTGHIEDLAAIGIATNSIDVVISNCVINLSPDKESVFREIFRVLKPGGELYFSDVFTGRRIPGALQSNSVLQGECLAGALYGEDFRRLLRTVGCLDYRVTSNTRIALGNPDIEAMVGNVEFYSTTLRTFKLKDLEDICEDYGQVATYKGSIPECPHRFTLDDHHDFEAGKPMRVCGNTASMLHDTRFGKHFVVTGDRSVHFGPFSCDTPAADNPASQDKLGPCC
ncbi:MAG: methyltransferase domain-containing protein [Planctomycetes bacterium]|nr:methyltransferase domain-containing protein [Planctomycetota bacterium]